MRSRSVWNRYTLRYRHGYAVTATLPLPRPGENEVAVTVPRPFSADPSKPDPAPVPLPMPGVTAADLEFLDVAIQTAARNVAAGGGPFAALIVHDGLVLALGTNEVTKALDPTAHAEVVAIRAACRRLHAVRLRDCVLYASCEPCPLCLSVCAWASLSRVVYAAERRDAMGAGYHDETFYEEFGHAAPPPRVPVQRAFAATAQEPFDAWRRQQAAIG